MMGEMYPPTTADYAIEERFGDGPAQVSPYGVPMAPEFGKEQRRERIATAVLAAMMGSVNKYYLDGEPIEGYGSAVKLAKTALIVADALIAALDK